MGLVLGFDAAMAAAGCTDPDGVAADLARDLGAGPALLEFVAESLPLSELAGWACAPASYLQDGDEDGYDRAVSLADAYACGDPVPPIVAVRAPYGWNVPDGLHRLSGACSAGVERVDALVARLR